MYIQMAYTHQGKNKKSNQLATTVFLKAKGKSQYQNALTNFNDDDNNYTIVRFESRRARQNRETDGNEKRTVQRFPQKLTATAS